MQQPTLKIGKTLVGRDHPCFIVAEIGINYDGDYNQALRLIDVATDAGCNAVKFQLFTAERMYAKKAGLYQIATGEKRDIIDIIKHSELPHEWITNLKKYANKKGVEFFVTACDEESADVLARAGVAAYKIASYEITHLPLFRHIAKKKKPVIFSCGGAMLSEVADAMQVFEEERNRAIALMHCIGEYPASPSQLNLRVLTTLQYAFPHAVIGYSDHSSNPVEAPRAAIALGAKIIEKHITLDRNLPGPDHSFAVNPSELKQLVKVVRSTEKQMRRGARIIVDPLLLGSSERITYKGEKKVREFTYRTVFAKKAIKRGEVFSSENIAVLRPGEHPRGLEPKYYELLIKGYKASRPIQENKSIVWNDVLFSS
ncbi:MAG: N-acetylneuraminate synthase family protein [Patescibacteria group bacterium]|nr:N-acetylneuraminate synthase family protein [Patescibacteria group bacterium]MDE2438450.1 N-acetylneuraminate synthase family protein [Patescibacteria group bacterium]